MADIALLLQWIAACAALAGFGWLALAMETHWLQVHGGSAASMPAGRLRWLGGCALAASALLCFMADRPSMAILVWLMLLAITAPLVGLALAWRPQWLRILWPARGAT